MPSRLLLVLIGLCLTTCILAQNDTTVSPAIGEAYLTQVSSKASWLDQQLDKQSQKVLSRLQQQEAKLQRKLARRDTAAASRIFHQSAHQYARLQDQLEHSGQLQQYIPSLDTLGSSLKFLQQNQRFLTGISGGSKQLNEAMAKVSSLQNNFQKAEQVKRFIRERKQYLKEQLGALGMVKELKQFNKQAYYYSAQVNEYKQLLKDHKKAERKALELLGKTSLFKEFMRKHSMLASLFRLPVDPNDPNAQASLAGLQTRAQVNSLVQQQIASGGPNAQAQFSQNMQEAQSQLSQLKDKVSKLGGGSSDLEMPEGFRPNHQRTKSFLQRIEIGANIQSLRSNGYLPVTSDIALTGGYKLNDNSMIGVGVSYKMGWGKSIRNINITHQGIGLRSFIEWKLKGSFWLAGGYEMNYRNGFSRFAELRDRSAWQESGLIGMSKTIDVRSKILKKTKVQLLWDFLSYHQIPKPSPVLFRVGYNF
ncbi:MAG: hypothetical protein DI535_05885 [Citrobacter freundii]|nr:MAG: hypothetical protein DI535_05885 [Citrobacter freundii]